MMPIRTVPRSPGRIGRGQGGAGFGEQGLAGVGELHAVRGAVEQPAAEFAFQAADRDRQRRLDQVQPGRGAGEALLLGDGDEVFQLPQLHSCSTFMNVMTSFRWTS
jgi:hypothetical protein